MSLANTKPASKRSGWQSHRAVVQFAEYMVGGGVYFWGGLAVFATGYNLLHWS